MLYQNTLFLGLVMLFCGASCAVQKKQVAESTPPQVILKLDDLWYEDGLVHPGWVQVIDFLQEQEVVGTVGVVCNSLEEGGDDYFQWIKDREAEGHEIWHHGYCHCKPVVDEEERREFRGTSYAYQYDHLLRAQQLAEDKLDIIFRTFGAPYNSTDNNTARALDSLPEIKIWLYKETSAPTSKYVFERIAEVNIEYPVHIPDLAQLKAGYEQHETEPVLVIQGHPRSWWEEPARFETFKQIVLFLKAEGVQFTTPYSYYQQHQESN